MHKFGFQSLDVYQLAKELVIQSYQLVKQFPESEKFALIQQINRAVVSIPSNIAEGYSRTSKKDRIHFLSISYGSLMEFVCQYEIAHSLGYVDDVNFDEMMKKAHDLSVRISNYRNYINAL